MADIANAVFTGNPDTGGEPEADGIFKSLPNAIHCFGATQNLDRRPDVLAT